MVLTVSVVRPPAKVRAEIGGAERDDGQREDGRVLDPSPGVRGGRRRRPVAASSSSMPSVAASRALASTARPAT